MAYGGWFGRLLRVDLSAGQVTEERIDEEVLGTWLGGRGLGVHTVAREVPPRCDPLGPLNKLVFATGPLTGAGVPGAGRFCAVAKSPLTNTILDSGAGGGWGVGLKGCGYDLLIIEGVAPEPVYLNIAPGESNLQPAADLMGNTTGVTISRLQARLGRDVNVACIGPAGEHQVRFAAVISNGGRALGRGGLGAVMGAKQLKAITTKGNMETPVASPQQLRFVQSEAGKWLKANPITAQGLPQFGTPVLVNILARLGVFPSHNFQYADRIDPQRISGEALAIEFPGKPHGCLGCPVQCSRQLQDHDREVMSPHYESVWALGPQCGIDHLETIVAANHRCNELGLDTISTGVTIGCAMELAAKGLLALPLVFGDRQGLLDTIEQIAYLQTPGHSLAQGSRRLAAQCGQVGYAMQVKGLELSAYDPRGLQGMGLGYATANRGGCHLRGYMVAMEVLGVPKMLDRCSTAGKAGLTINRQNIGAAMDSLIACRLINLAVAEEYFARMLTAVTGRAYQPQALYRSGERIWNLERLYNRRIGFDHTADTLPPRLLAEPITQGASRGQVVDLAPMLTEYYRFRGWTDDGQPTPEKVQQLGLAEFLC
jgi:aldehyde:ferredoxin oxidoreductase